MNANENAESMDGSPVPGPLFPIPTISILETTGAEPLKLTPPQLTDFLAAPPSSLDVEKASFVFSPTSIALRSKKTANRLLAFKLLLRFATHHGCGLDPCLCLNPLEAKLVWRAPGKWAPSPHHRASLGAEYEQTLKVLAGRASAAPLAAPPTVKHLLIWVSPSETKAWARTCGQGGTQLRDFKAQFRVNVKQCGARPERLEVCGAEEDVESAISGLESWRDQVLAPFYRPSHFATIFDVCVFFFLCVCMCVRAAWQQRAPC